MRERLGTQCVKLPMTNDMLKIIEMNINCD